MINNTDKLPLEEFLFYKPNHKFHIDAFYLDNNDHNTQEFNDFLVKVSIESGGNVSMKDIAKLYKKNTGINIQIKNEYDDFIQKEGRKYRNLIQIPDPSYEKEGYTELKELTNRIVKKGHYPSLKGFIASLEVNLDWVKQDIDIYPMSQNLRQYDRLVGEIEKVATALLIEESKVSQILHRHSTTSIADTIRHINYELVNYIRKSPCRLHRLSSRQFEKFIADILTNFGWEVELTQETKDGGYDIFGVSKSSPDMKFKTTYIVECKKNSPENKVGVSIARELLQVKNEMKVSNALLITTSDFTKGVYDYSINRHDFEVRNFDEIIEWCKYYK